MSCENRLILGPIPTTPKKVYQQIQSLSKSFIRLSSSNSITVLIPARNEEQTISSIIKSLVDRYQIDGKPLIEIVVIDDHSTDKTSLIALEAGASVVHRQDENAPTGKAETILEGLKNYESDIYVLFDADVYNFNPFWLELLCLELDDPKILLAKGTYQRPDVNHSENQLKVSEGGRVTELVARPLLSMCFPELASFRQPLSGEIAFRRSIAKKIPLTMGYGFDVGLLVDTYLTFGIESISEVDLGSRVHSHQDLTALSFQAAQVAMTILHKAGIDIAQFPGYRQLKRVDGTIKTVPFGLLELP